MKKPTNVLRVHDRMSRDPFTVAPDDSLQTVVDLLRRRDIRAVPVVEMGRLIGIVTDRDLRQVAPSYPLFRDETEIRRYTENLRVTAAMTADPLRVSTPPWSKRPKFWRPTASVLCRWLMARLWSA